MTTRFTATQLDLSRQPAPDLVRAVSYDAIKARRKANFVARANARGFNYNVDSLESDPMIVHIEEDAYAEQLDLQAINDAGKARMLAYALDADLDHIGYMFGVTRLLGEDNERFRKRIQAAPDAYGAAGSAGAYYFHAMSADVRVQDVGMLDHTMPGVLPGQVPVIVMAPDDVIDDAISNVRARLFQKDVRPLTDMVSVRKAKKVLYSIEAVVEIPRGPDPDVARAEAEARLALYQADQNHIGGLIAKSGLDACFQVRVARRVRQISPAADVDPGADGYPVCTGVKLTMELTGG